jgi:hypothetical protein
MSWSGVCWRCKGQTPRVVAISDADEQETPCEPNDNLGAVMQAEFPYFKKGYSRTMDEECWANWCTSCDALQGNFYVHIEEWVVEMILLHDSLDSMVENGVVQEHESINIVAD